MLPKKVLTGIKNAGVDVRLSEWGESIREVIESYDAI